MRFSRLAEYFESIEQTSSRLEMTRILSDLFKEADRDEIAQILYLLQGRVAPLYEKVEFNMGEKMVIKASARAVGVELNVFTTLFKKKGDIGVAIEELKKQASTLFSKDLSILDVFNQLGRLADSSGVGSQDLKISILSGLIQELDPLSCRFVVRIPINKLRLGFSDVTILDGFSWMLKGDKSLRGVIEKAYHVRPDIGFIGKTIKESSEKGLTHVKPAVFTPILMMRAERLADPKDIFEKVPEGIIEEKYDGFRLQIHANKSGVKLFSRSLENVTEMYPDIVLAISTEIKYKNIIIEGEAVGYSTKTGKLLPFQETVQRKRKYDIEAKSKEIPLRLFVFDLLYLNGKSLIDEPLKHRRELLSGLVKNTAKNTLNLAPETIARAPEDIKKSFLKSIEDNLEGIMVKKPDGAYQPNARNWNWIKYKKSYATKVEDTIDCLVMGYDFGQGKRSGFGIGALLIGVYDGQKDVFKTVSKLGTGLTDIEWREVKKLCDQSLSKKKPLNYSVDKQMAVDVWVKPSIVLEIRSDEITKSPMHTAHLALRFPRLERLRDDKRPDDVTTIEEVEQLFKLQNR
ncbi:hypothetical protein A2690_03345 [Candidatus Roizmanbacteria bacterium RIFCSPHIGHO2_01_FULL_39_12b]|uniref:Probable DNA ligase n=1 Tax=Candidatus Roizmanbacteria bacterium RIFCSPHIGHO2_01_FULL_39_12b TaxID=1802030 RepID=A0A1F7GCL2_9BACT|nr:MAG: hypothetical protein A2690_03345 [Candidatus Roizmanbacteria bacterium RIFCSPHIGHO2_01_FULL_39_12b]OGK46713.1 MAG: hypothetical protein A3B46_02595 [Candidatus Roizmanbacteria bacterium RIFCSPLOWO2_01_FULL_39_19]